MLKIKKHLDNSYYCKGSDDVHSNRIYFLAMVILLFFFIIPSGCDSNDDLVTEQVDPDELLDPEPEPEEETDEPEPEALEPIEKTIEIEQWQTMRLIIPAIEVDLICVGDGDVYDEELLDQGPTHFQMSDLPSTEKGNVAFAGYRAGRWGYFLDLDLLEEGDEIYLDVEDGYRFIYLVEWVEITDKYDWGPLDSTDYPAITLNTSDPKHEKSPDYRLNVRGKLDKVTRIPEEN